MSEENKSNNSSNNKSGQKRRNNKNRRRRPSGNKSNNNNLQAKKASGNNSGGNSSGPKSGNNNKRRRRRRRRPSENLSPLEKLFRKYDNLLEQHLIARKKYYEFFHRADPRQKVKLEGNFVRSIKEVREFEESLHGEDKEKFLQKYDGYTLDTTYTSNREMPIEGDKVSFEGEFEDPHYLPSQAESDFSADTEESSGTMDDYLAYKGLN